MASGKGGLQRLSKQKSVMNIEANPLESGNIQSASMKVESLSDCVPISSGDLTALIARLTALEVNENRLKMLDEAKIPYLFTSEQLLKILEITTSIKTKIQMIAQIGPRLLDPRAKTQQFLDLFRFSDEKNQVEEILKARNQAISSSQFSTASSGRGGAGRGGMLAGGRGGAGRGASGRGGAAGATSNAGASRPLPAAPAAETSKHNNTAASGNENAPAAPLTTPAKKLEVTIAAENPPSHPFSPGSAVSTPGGNDVVLHNDMDEVFNFLDSMGTPSSARASRRITMESIAERNDEVDEEDSEEDDDDCDSNGKPSQPVTDDTSLTTTETAPSVSTIASSSPYVQSQLTTNGSMAHNLSDGSLTETDSKAADAAVAIIAAIVAKEIVTEKGKTTTAPSTPNVTVETTTAAAAATVPAPGKDKPAALTLIEDEGPEGGLLLPPLSSSRPSSMRLAEESHSHAFTEENGNSSANPSNTLNQINSHSSSSDSFTGSLIHTTSMLDLNGRPRSHSNPSANEVSSTAGVSPMNSTTSNISFFPPPADRNSMLRQALHHSSFTVGTVSTKDEELQAVATASSQMRQVAAKLFSGGDRESAIAAVTATTSARTTGTLQRTQSEIISKELSRSTGSIQYQPHSATIASTIHNSSSSSIKKPIAAAAGSTEDLAIRYATLAKLSKDQFLALTPTEPMGTNEQGESLYSYQELLRRNFRKDYGELKQSELQRYLVDAEFLIVFQKSKVEFEAQAKWRQVDQKKKVMLF